MEDSYHSAPDVHCYFCRSQVPDPGRRRATCPNCGNSPLPSRVYGRDECMYPRPRAKTLDELHEEALERHRQRTLHSKPARSYKK